jgi:predicted ATPase
VLGQRLDTALRTGRGTLVLLSGEAGIGKTSVARVWSASRPGVRALWGACDALDTPRPLGPLVDVAEQAGRALARLAAGSPSPAAIVRALSVELRARRSLVVLEDVHWADGATLDLNQAQHRGGWASKAPKGPVLQGFERRGGLACVGLK